MLLLMQIPVLLLAAGVICIIYESPIYLLTLKEYDMAILVINKMLK